MASIKIFSLAIKTLAKPIASQIKSQATQHESFRNICIALAQRMHRTEARMRMGLLNEESANIKPLNDAKAVQNGANTLAESFLFIVGAGLVLGETYRASRKNAERRDNVADDIAWLKNKVQELEAKENNKIEEVDSKYDVRFTGLEKALNSIVTSGLKSGWTGLGHSESEVINLIGELPGQPLAMRTRDGSERVEGGAGAGAGEQGVGAETT